MHLHLNKHIIRFIITDAVDVVTVALNIEPRYKTFYKKIHFVFLTRRIVTHDKPHSCSTHPTAKPKLFAYDICRNDRIPLRQPMIF